MVAGGGHHGGAWKVAYADFVTAMMAFFLLMWLLNATTEKQRKGLSDYFNPTIPISRVSGGGDSALSGDTIFAEDTRARNGTGGTARERGASAGSDEDALARAAMAEAQKQLEKQLFDRGGESNTMERMLRHVITRITDEGLVIELFDLEGATLFKGDTAVPEETTVALAALLVEVLAITANELAVNGHLRSAPIPRSDAPAWDLSTDRAQAIRALLQAAGLPPERMQRIGGFSDRKPATADPSALRNNRIEIVLLRRDR